MKTTLYTSPHLETAVSKLFEVLKDFDKETLDLKNIVLVPDRYTQTFERQLFEKLHKKGSFCTEIFSFSRLLFRLKQNAGAKYLERQCGVMAIKKIIGENQAEILSFKKSLTSKSFAEKMYDIIQKLKSFDFDFDGDGIKNLSEKLKLRLCDIRLIYRKYEEFLAEGWFDGCDLLSELPAILETGKLKDVNIFIAGFEIFSEQEKRAIAAFMKAGFPITVFCCVKLSIFESSGLVLDAITEICKEEKNELIQYSVLPNYNAFQTATANYFFEEIKSTVNCNGALTVYQASSAFDEAKFIAENIRLLVLKDGYRYQDIFVAMSDVSLENKLKKLFAEYEIPAFFNQKQALSAHPATLFLTDCINLFRQNLDRQAVLRLAKNLFFEEKSSDVDCFENYCLKYGTDRTGFLTEFNPQDVLYAKAEKIRLKLCKLYDDLNLPKSGLAGEYSEKLLTFMEEIKLEKALQIFHEQLKTGGQLLYEEYSSQVFEGNCGILQDIERIFGNQTLSILEFYDLFVSGTDALQIATSPVECDSVQVGDLKSTLFAGGKCVFIAGLHKGFPPILQPAGILSDGDIDELNRCGAKLFITNDFLDSRNRFDAVTLAASNFERITYSADVSDSNYPELLRNYFSIAQNANLLSRQKITLEELHCLDNQTPYLSALKNTLKADLHKLIENYSLAKSGERFNLLLFDAHYSALKKSCLSPVLERAINGYKTLESYDFSKLYFKNAQTSVSVIECFYTCPFKHFMRYGLKAKVREEADLNPLDIGNFLHRVAELFVSYKSTLPVAEIVEGIIEKILLEEEFKRYFSENSKKSVLAKLKEECVHFCSAIQDQLLHSKFKPMFTEVSFADGGQFPPITVKGFPYKITGKIDRLDVFSHAGKKYARIIDYKSGNKKYQLNDVQLGTSLQLFVYLYALISRGEYLPAGVYYFPILDQFSEEENPHLLYKLRGVTLSELSVLYASDDKLKESFSSDVIPVSLTEKDGRMQISTRSKVLDEQSFKEMTEFCIRMIVQAKKRIEKGERDIFPVSKGCEYCEYKPVCENYQPVKLRKAEKIFDFSKALQEDSNVK